MQINKITLILQVSFTSKGINYNCLTKFVVIMEKMRKVISLL
jgi:hypothetical protein